MNAKIKHLFSANIVRLYTSSYSHFFTCKVGGVTNWIEPQHSLPSLMMEGVFLIGSFLELAMKVGVSNLIKVILC